MISFAALLKGCCRGTFPKGLKSLRLADISGRRTWDGEPGGPAGPAGVSRVPPKVLAAAPQTRLAYTRHTPGIHPAYTRHTPRRRLATQDHSAAMSMPFLGRFQAGNVRPGARKYMLRARSRPGPAYIARREPTGCAPGEPRVYAGCTPGVCRVYPGCIPGVRHRVRATGHASRGPCNTLEARFSCPAARRARPAATRGLWWAAEVHANAPEIT